MQVAEVAGRRAAQWGEDMVDVINRLDRRVTALEATVRWEEELRKQNPALQDLYEKFQATKKLMT